MSVLASATQILEVDPRGEVSRHRSIKQAVHAAWFDAVRRKIRADILEENAPNIVDYEIRVHTGVYEDDLTFPKRFPSNLRIKIAALVPGEIEIVYSNESQQIVAAPLLSLEGLNIRNLSTDGFPTFLVTDGARFEMLNCRVTGPGHGCVHVSGASSSAFLQDCEFSLSNEAFSASNGASVEISGCVVSRMSGHLGSSVGAGSRVDVRGSRFFRGRDFVVGFDAAATFIDSDFEGDWTPVKERPDRDSNLFVAIAAESRLDVTGCSFKRFETCVAALKSEARVVAEDNAAADAGNFVLLRGDGEVALRRNAAESIAFLAVFDSPAGKIELVDNDASNALHHAKPLVILDRRLEAVFGKFKAFDVKMVDGEKIGTLDRRERAIYAKAMKKRMELSGKENATLLLRRLSWRKPSFMINKSDSDRSPSLAQL